MGDKRNCLRLFHLVNFLLDHFIIDLSLIFIHNERTSPTSYYSFDSIILLIKEVQIV